MARKPDPEIVRGYNIRMCIRIDKKVVVNRLQEDLLNQDK